MFWSVENQPFYCSNHHKNTSTKFDVNLKNKTCFKRAITFWHRTVSLQLKIKIYFKKGFSTNQLYWLYHRHTSHKSRFKRIFTAKRGIVQRTPKHEGLGNLMVGSHKNPNSKIMFHSNCSTCLKKTISIVKINCIKIKI